MKLNRLTLKNKKIFNRFLRLAPHELSTYAFENIYLWRGLFAIYWSIIQGNLCIFFKDKSGWFLYLPPLAKEFKPKAVKEAFHILDRFNRRKEISRIENVEEKDIPLYQDLNYKCIYKSCDYLCNRRDLVELKGNKYKPKRACFNYFMKHYKFRYLPFSLSYRNDCLRLYNLWVNKRRLKSKDRVYQYMLEDSRACLKILLRHHHHLKPVGRVVKINHEIKAFSFGFRLNKDTFCILYEITDLSIKGLAQFIFREFCRELTDYKYINIMDDSGLDNLEKVKLSYRPVKLIPAYLITRNE
jgi:hypothetical protein